ncbi:MAG: HAD family phosphatase [Deltaproteobacteria bacterium]|nr:HAD family phosphatase [Deltaproteobacteria bacterium]
MSKASDTSSSRSAAPGRFRGVLFDYGGVFTPSPFSAVAALAAEIGTESDLLVEVVFGSYEDDTDHPWHRLERGEITVQDARTGVQELGAARGFEADLFKFFAAMGGSGGIRQDLVACVRGLREMGLRTGLLTNNVAEFREYWRKSLPEGIFDDVVDSSEVGLRKPDPRIFALACERLGIEPHQAIFLDDHPGNIRGARAAGLEAVLVEEDPSGALRELERLLAR